MSTTEPSAEEDKPLCALLAELTAEVACITDSYDRVEYIINGTSARAEEAQRKVDDLQSELVDQDKIITELRQRLKKEISRRRKYEMKYKSITRDLEVIKTTLRVTKGELRRAKGAKDLMANKIVDLEDKLTANNVEHRPTWQYGF